MAEDSAIVLMHLQYQAYDQLKSWEPLPADIGGSGHLGVTRTRRSIKCLSCKQGNYIFVYEQGSVYSSAYTFIAVSPKTSQQ